MWVAKLLFRHDCILGNRCKKFNVSLQGVVFSVFKEKNRMLSSSMLYASGKEKNMRDFYKDLKKDPAVVKLDQKENMCLLIEKATSKAVQFYGPKLIFIRPVLMDSTGFEHWEIGSWEKEVVMDFVNKVEKHVPEFKLVSFRNIKMNNLYFPKLIPNLTEKQRWALELAIKEGYYKSPKKTSIRNLAKIFDCSVGNFQKHLQKAEEKVIPDTISYLK